MPTPGDGHLAGRGAERRLHLPVAEAHPSGYRQRCRRRSLGLGRAREANGAVLRHRPQAAAEVERFRTPLPQREDLVRLDAGERTRPAPGGALGQPAKQQPSHRRRQLAQGGERYRRTSAGRLQRIVDGVVQDLGLLTQLPGRLGDRALGRRGQLPQPGQHVVADPRAGEATVVVGGVLAPLELTRAQVAPHLVAGDLEERAHQPAATSGHAVQRPGAGRYREPVEHRLGLVAGGVGGGVVGLGVALGERVAGVPGPLLEVPARGRLLERLDHERHLQPVA